MTNLHRHASLTQRIHHYWQQRLFLKRYLNKCLHPKLVSLFFSSLLASHRYIQETRFKRRALSTLPLCLIVGATHSGKSSLIDNSGLSLYAGEGLNSRYQPIAAHSMPQFRHTHSKFFVELPAYLFINESVKHVPYLQHLLDFMQFFGYLDKTREIIYTLSLEDLLTDTEHQQRQFNEFFASFTILLNKIPKAVNVHLVITKVDRLLGFSEFFDDLSFEERQLPCGIGLSTPSLILTNQKQFHHLVRRLTERLFWRCHSEHQLQRRLLVADFPQQFSAQEHLLTRYWEQLADVQHATLNARFKTLHWVSNAQSGKLIDLLRSQAVALMHLPTAHCLPLLVQRKTFFVRGFFQHMHAISQEANATLKKSLPTTKPAASLPLRPTWLKKLSKPIKNWLSWRLLTAVVICVLVVIGVSVLYYEQSEKALNALPITNLQQNPALAYTLITANNPTQALQAYINHVAPKLSLSEQQTLVTDPLIKQKILTAAIAYVNQAWQEQVRQFYQQNLANYYPLDPSAKNELDLKKFTTFYGPAGVLDQFHKQYLDHFLKRYAVTLTLPAKQLFAATQTLQQNLFNSDGALALNFSLSLKQLNANVQQIDLRIAGTDFSVKAHTIINKSIHWPSNTADNSSGYNLQLRDSTAQQVMYTGVWSAFKLLQQCHFDDFSKDPSGTYNGDLILNKDSVQLMITSQQDIATLLPLFNQLTVPTLII